jgi:hypothetical protein
MWRDIPNSPSSQNIMRLNKYRRMIFLGLKVEVQGLDFMAHPL